jgi:hypothetical protein
METGRRKVRTFYRKKRGFVGDVSTVVGVRGDPSCKARASLMKTRFTTIELARFGPY